MAIDGFQEPMNRARLQNHRRVEYILLLVAIAWKLVNSSSIGQRSSIQPVRPESKFIHGYRVNVNNNVDHAEHDDIYDVDDEPESLVSVETLVDLNLLADSINLHPDLPPHMRTDLFEEFEQEEKYEWVCDYVCE